MSQPSRISPADVMEACFTDRPDDCEPRHAPEVADVMDCSYNTAREKLEILVEHGELRKKNMGTVVFWKPCYTEDV